jgi:hypothetical protein
MQASNTHSLWAWLCVRLPNPEFPDPEIPNPEIPNPKFPNPETQPLVGSRARFLSFPTVRPRDCLLRVPFWALIDPSADARAQEPWGVGIGHLRRPEAKPRGYITEVNRIPLVLVGTRNRILGTYLAANNMNFISVMVLLEQSRHDNLLDTPLPLRQFKS